MYIYAINMLYMKFCVFSQRSYSELPSRQTSNRMGFNDVFEFYVSLFSSSCSSSFKSNFIFFFYPLFWFWFWSLPPFVNMITTNCNAAHSLPTTYLGKSLWNGEVLPISLTCMLWSCKIYFIFDMVLLNWLDNVIFLLVLVLLF